MISDTVKKVYYGASGVLGATLLSKHFDSKWAGLLVALPIMTILGFIFISSNTSFEVTQRYLQISKMLLTL